MNTFVIVKHEQDKFDKKHKLRSNKFDHRILDEQWQLEQATIANIKHMRRVCPHCHIEISGSGVCDICGYELSKK